MSIEGGSLDVYYFYGEGCLHCAKVKPFLAEMEKKYPLQIHKYDVYNNRSCLSLFDDYSNKYGVSYEGRGVPAVFVSDTYFVGDSPIIEALEKVVKNALKKSTLSDQTSKTENTEGSDVEVTPASGSISILTVTIAGLVDSISPCSIAILVFLIGARVLVANQRRRVLRIGLAFCLSVFVTYFLFGLGLISFVQVGGFSNIFSMIVGLVAVLVGIFYLKDVFLYGKYGFTMEVPHSLKPLLTKMLKGVTSPLGAFAIGFVVVCFELPCTGGPYLFILGQLVDSNTRLKTVPLLLYYNFLFVLPLIIVSLLLYSNLLSIGKIREWNEKNKRPLRFISGFMMIALGFLTMTISQAVQLVKLFLNSFRVVGLPLLIVVFLYLVVCFPKQRKIAPKLTHPLALVFLLLFSLVGIGFLMRKPILPPIFSVQSLPIVSSLSCGATVTTDTILTEDLLNCPGNGLVIGASGIILDCDGHTISGDGDASGTGIDIYLKSSVTVKNCTIRDFGRGIDLEFASYNTMINNTIHNMHYGYLAGIGILLSSTTELPPSSYNEISYNKIYDNEAHGIFFRFSSCGNNIITYNKIYSNGFAGISLNSNGNTISYNEINDNSWNGLLFSAETSNSINKNIVCYNAPNDFNALYSVGTGDDNMCDNPDGWNDEGTTGCTYSCPSQINALAVPLNWQGDQASFNEEVNAQLDLFIDDVTLKDCPYKMKVEKLDVSSQNFDSFTCSQSNCGVGSIKPFVESLGINPRNYDFIIGFVETSPCSPTVGCSNEVDTVWVTTTYDIVTAHEIGHLYDLEDEYCSNQAGSSDSRCNDGDIQGDGSATGDINYLDPNLPCDCPPDGSDDSTGSPCCNNPGLAQCSSVNYGVCCYGNKNSKGGRATMSYANAPGSRGFDNHSQQHLDNIEELSCPNIPVTQTLGVQSGSSNEVIDVSLWVYQDDSVDENYLILMDGKPTNYYQQGDYSLRVFNNADLLIWNQALDIYFGYNGPVVLGEDYSAISNEKFPLSYKIPYDSSMYELKLYHGENEIYSKILDFCNLNSVCDSTETYLSCPEDCPLNETDQICVPDDDGVCDPDCAEGVDPDCPSAPVPEFPIGMVLEIALIPVIIFAWWKNRQRKFQGNNAQA